MKGASYHCDICEDGPFHARHQVVGLNVVEEIGCLGHCDPGNAEKHICITCAEFIAKALRWKPPVKKKVKKK